MDFVLMPPGHTIFDPTKSSTFKRSTGESWQIQYGDSSTASGDVGTDVVKVSCTSQAEARVVLTPSRSVASASRTRPSSSPSSCLTNSSKEPATVSWVSHGVRSSLSSK